MNFDMYREIILDHSKNPRNFGEVRPADGEAEKNNPLCGDRIRITFKLDKNKKIKEIKFSGAGCSITRAAASILTEKVKGKSLAQLKKYSDQKFLHDLVAPITPARYKCALLSLESLRQAMETGKRIAKKK